MFQYLTAALTFLSIIPGPPDARIIPVGKIGNTLVFYPIVGMILGGILAGLFHLLGMGAPPLVAAFILTMAWALLTGGLHLDGVADLADAIFSSRDRERALAIMKDSRIGVMGAIALFGLLGGKIVALSHISSPLSIFLVVVLGRWAMVLAATTSRYARAEGGLASGILQPSPRRLALATLAALPAFAVIPIQGGLAALAIVILVTLVIRAICNWRLGGLTGDCLGAICEVAEVTVLLAEVIIHRLVGAA